MKLLSRYERSSADSRSSNAPEQGDNHSRRVPSVRAGGPETEAYERPCSRMASGGRIGISRREFLVASAGIGTLLVCGLSSAVAEEDRPVRIGFILPETGPLAAEAASLMAGFEYFMAEKGVDAPPLDIVKRDSGPKDEKTLEALAELVMNKEVQFLVGPPSLGGSEKAVHAVAGSNVILFVTNRSVRLVGGELCLTGSFRLCGNNYQSSQPLAPWAVKNLGRKVFITGDDDTQGNEEADYFAYGFEKAGGTFGDRLMVGADTGKMDDLLEAIRKTAPDFIFASFREGPAVGFLKAVRDASPALTQPVVGPESLTAFPHTLALCGKNAEGVRTLTTLEDPVEFVGRIKQKTGRDVASAIRAAEGCDLAAVILHALREAGLRDADVTRTIKAIENTEISGPRGRIQFDKNHEPILEVMVQQWETVGGNPTRKIVEKLGASRTLDFGCGRMGFPKRPESEKKDDTEIIWEEKDE
ncbi:MAG: ABC transporter substrate-binding protein [Desulfomonile tiedjei]|nr:ABC transporter substrate-binding protein [Desulfomonile tiedjei]